MKILNIDESFLIFLVVEKEILFVHSPGSVMDTQGQGINSNHNGGTYIVNTVLSFV